MRILAILLLPFALVGLSPTGAAAFGADNGLRVFGTAEGFEVFGGSAGSRVFCAAGEFARSQLGASPTDRVVLVRPYGPSLTQPHQRSVGFRLADRQSATRWGGGVVLFTGEAGVGQNRSVAHAVHLCNDFNRK